MGSYKDWRIVKIKALEKNLSCGFVGGGGLVGGGSGLVGLGFVLGVDSLAFVFDISDVTVVVVSGVGDGLDTTIGKSNLVRSGDSLAVGGFLGVEVGARVVIGNSVLESGIALPESVGTRGGISLRV